MAINFNSFTEGTTSNIQSNDYVVGFGDTNPNGERKWTVSTIANAVSGITNLNRLSDASAVNGLVKCNGSGDFSAAVAGTDYLTSTSLSASPMVAKAWVNFNGSFASSSYTLANGGIRAAYNVSSITDNGSPGYGNGGDYTVNLVPGVFSNGNYTVIGTVGNSATSPSPSQWCFAVTDFSTPRTATACRVGSYTFRQDGYVQQVDNDYMNVAFFGN